MNGRKAVIGLAVLCALVMSAVAASGASAATSGTTAFTCQSGFGTAGKFTDAHCTKEGAGAFKHVGFTGSTGISGTNEKTASETTAAAPAVLEGTLSGIVTAVTCTTVGGTGTMSNVLSGEEHSASGSGTINYSGCTVTKPAGRECQVKEGKVTTKELTATTKGAGMELEFVGVGTGKEFATITIEKCKENKPPNEPYPVTGSVKIPPSGATLTSTVATTKAQGTLIFGGNPSGLGGALTISNSTSGTPLTVTTAPFTE